MAQRHCGEWRAAEARLSLVCDLTLTTPMLRLRGCTWNYMKFVLASAHVRTRGALWREIHRLIIGDHTVRTVTVLACSRVS